MKLIKFLFIVIFALGLANVTYANRSLDDSQAMTNIALEIRTLEKENIQTTAAVGEAGSLTKISETLVSAGYVESPKVVSIMTSSNVASR